MTSQREMLPLVMLSIEVYIRINGLSFSLDRIRAFSNSVKRDRCVEKKEKHSLCNIDLYTNGQDYSNQKPAVQSVYNLLPRLSRHNQMVSQKFVNPLQICFVAIFCTNHREQILQNYKRMGKKKKRLSDDIFPNPLKGQTKKSVNEWRHYFSI